MGKLIRMTTVPISLRLLLTGQMRFMREHGLEVLMISADGPERKDVMASEGCPHVIIPMTRAITPVQDLRCLWQLVSLFRRENPDIVHTHTPKAGLLGMLAAWMTGVPVRIHTVAGMPLMTTTGFRRRLLGWMERLTYAAAQEVWPNSRSLYKFILDQGFTRQEKLHIIGPGSSNGIDLERWSQLSLHEEVLNKVKQIINYQPEATYLLAVGRVVRDKGIVELIRAFSAVKKLFPDLRLVLLGPLERERIEELLPQETLHTIETDPDIIHLHWSDEVEYYLHLASLFIHASYREGFPNVLLQAGAMGCPILCSDIPGNTDIVTDSETGVCFQVGNSNDLKEKLSFALSHPEEMKQIANRLLSKIRQEYDRKNLHRELLERYCRLLGKANFVSISKS